MREQSIKGFRGLVARNWDRIDSCCGTDTFKQICEECNIAYNVMCWALHRLALKFKSEHKSRTFVFKTFWRDKEGLFIEMKAKTTRETVWLMISTRTLDRERTRNLSAKKEIKKS